MAERETLYRHALNERLDARAFFEAIGYHTDKLRTIGRGERAPMKSPCPVHGESRLSTLMIDPARNTCKCIVARCEAHEGVDLIELLSLVRALSIPAAAIEAAALVSQELEPKEKAAIAEDLVDEARSLLDDQDYDAANETLGRLNRLQPAHPEAPALVARAAEASGDPEEAAASYRRLASAALQGGDASRAVKLLRDDALRLLPDDEASLELLAEAAEASGDADGARAALLQVVRLLLRRSSSDGPASGAVLEHLDGLGDSLDSEGDLLLRRGEGRAEAGRLTEARQDARRALEFIAKDSPLHRRAVNLLARAAEDDPHCHQTAARALMDAGETELAEQHYLLAAEWFLKAEDDTSASACLDSVCGPAPTDASRARRAAEVLTKAGKKDQAAQRLAACAAALIHAKKPGQALTVADEAMALHCNCMVAAGAALSALESGAVTEGDPQERLFPLLEAAREAGDAAVATRAVRALEAAEPDNLDVLYRLAEDARDHEGPEAGATRLSAAAADLKDLAKASSLLRQALDWDPKRREDRIRLIQILEAEGQTGEAFEQAQRLISLPDPEEEDAAILERLAGDDPDRLFEAGQALVDAGLNERALLVLRDLIESPDPGIRLRAAEMARSASPGDRHLLGFLVEAYRSAGRIDDAIGAGMDLARHLDGERERLRLLHLLEQLVEMDDKAIEPRRELARAHEAADERAEAAYHWFELARLLHHKGQKEEARQTAGHAAELQERDPQPILWLSARMREEGEAEKALQTLLNTGRKLLAQDILEGAEAVAGTLLADWPEDMEVLDLAVRIRLERNDAAGALQALRLLASAAEKEGDVARRQEALAGVAELDPSDLDARKELIALLRNGGPERETDLVAALSEMARASAAAEDWEQALDAERRLLELRPEDLAARAHYAGMLEKAGDVARAAEEYVKLGKAHRHLGAIAAAAEAVEAAFRLRPGFAEALRLRMEIARDKEENTSFVESGALLVEALGTEDRSLEATEVARGVAESQPDNPNARELLALCLVREGKVREAAIVRLETAEMLVKDHRKTRAQTAIEELEAMEVRDAEVLSRSGAVWLALDMPDRARGCLLGAAQALIQAGDCLAALKCLDSMPDVKADVEWLRARTDALKALGRAGEAVEAMRETARQAKAPERAEMLLQALELDPQNAELLWETAEALDAAKRKEEAADHYLEASVRLEKDGDLDQALESVERARRLRPDATFVHRRLSTIQRERGNAEEAMAHIRRLIELEIKSGASPETLLPLLDEGLQLKKDSVDLRLEKGRALRALDRREEASEQFGAAARQLLEEGKIEEARKALSDAVELDAKSEVALEVSARLMEKEGRVEEALAEYYALAESAAKQGTIERAHALTESVLERLPSALDWRVQVAGMFAREGIPELAAREFTEAASAYKKQGQTEEAREACRKAIECRPRDVEAHELLVDCCKELRDSSGAADALDELSRLFEMQGQMDESAKALKAVVAFRPDDPDLRRRLADVQQRSGRTGEAIEELRVLSRLQSENANDDEAAATLRRLLTMAPEDTRARADLLRISEGNQEPRELLDDHLKLADIYQRRGDSEAALEVLGHAAQIDPALPQTHDRMLSILLETGKDDEALEKGLELANIYCSLDEPRRAADALNRLKRIGTGNPRLLRVQARVHTALNARGNAMAALREAARLYREKGDREARIEVYRDILELDPLNVETRQELVNLLRKLDRTEEAARAQIALGRVYLQRGMPDSAEAEFRAVTILTPLDDTAWQGLIEAHLQYGEEADLVSDYLRFGELLKQQGRRVEALEHFSAVIRLDPRNIKAREEYIELYTQEGDPADLVEDYLALADLLISNERIDEGVRLFSKVMSLDPENREARDRLTETQARINEGKKILPARETPAVPVRHQRSLQPDESNPHEPQLTREQEAMAETMVSTRRSPDELLKEEIGSMDEGDEKAALDQVASNYRDILAINPNNANVRLKLADVLDQLGRTQEMLVELAQASETFYKKNEHNACIQVCDRILKADPSNQKIRLRLQQSLNRRDAFKALESAIIFSDNALDDTRPGRKVKPPDT